MDVCARRPAIAFPSTSSELPLEYTSAVSNMLTPASRQTSTSRVASATSLEPHALKNSLLPPPKVPVPKLSKGTLKPELPSLLNSIDSSRDDCPTAAAVNIECRVMPKSRSQPPQAEMRGLIAGYWVSRLIYVAAKLGIADLLKDGPRTAGDLAAAAGVHAPALYRVLRTLSGYGLFSESTGQRFKLTPLGATLRP